MKITTLSPEVRKLLKMLVANARWSGVKVHDSDLISVCDEASDFIDKIDQEQANREYHARRIIRS